MRSDRSAEPLWIRLTAGVIAVAFMAGMARLMLQLPAPNPLTEQAGVELRWVLPAAMPAAPPQPQTVPMPAAAPALVVPSHADTPLPANQARVSAAPSAAPTAPAAAQAAWSQRLYGRDGSLAGPPSGTVPAQKDAAQQVFQHRDELATGVGERPLEKMVSGMFEDKKKPPTLGEMGARLIHGRDIQPAQARRPPDVAFNPGLHERPSDLGSEATGDAYKAAPIRYEKAPDMRGGASRRIRLAIGALEQRYPRCNGEQRRRWLGIAQQHLDALQRVEYRYNNGADPVEAEHSLPSAADSAYDLARRALWDAERRMKTCT